MAFSFLRFKATHNPATADGRSQERHRRIALTVAASALAQGVSFLSSFIWIPLVISYLGQEMYGLLMTFVTAVMMFQFADLGLGNGLINVVSEAKGREDPQTIQQSISSSFFLLSGIALVMIALFLFLNWKIDWIHLLNIQSSLGDDNIHRLISIFFICFALTLPLSVVQKVQIGLQQGFIAHLCQWAGSLLTLAMIVSGVYFKLGASFIVWGIAGAPVLVLLVNNIYYWGFAAREWRPKLQKIHSKNTNKLLQVGWLFFVLSVTGALGFQSDNIILLKIFGPETVALYAVVAKLFSLTPMVLGYILMPLWPAYREALIKEDLDWVKKTLKRSIKLGLSINIPCALIFTFFGPQIIKLWIGQEIVPSFDLLLGFGIWTLLNGVVGPFAAFFNSANLIRFQIITSLMMGVSNILISILLAHLIGPSGVIYGSVLALTFFTLIPCFWKMRRFFRSYKTKDLKAYG